MTEKKFCSQCQKQQPVTDGSKWIKNKYTRRWQCEWCVAKVKRPEKNHD